MFGVFGLQIVFAETNSSLGKILYFEVFPGLNWCAFLMFRKGVFMKSDKGFSFSWGAITLLDFLGWKGVWLNDYKKRSEFPSLCIRNSLQALAKFITEAQKISEEYCSNCTFLSISDTIAILSSCEKDDGTNYRCLQTHSVISSLLLDAAANEGFALRGATTIGEHASLDNIIVGPGVDECASWYEQADWLGVVYAPSAQFIIDEKRRDTTAIENAGEKQKRWSDAKIVEYDRIPLKNGIKVL